MAPGATPRLVRETDKCIAIEHPFPQASKHFVLFPKRDVKNITDVSVDDGLYVLGCLDLMRILVAERKMTNYQVLTNGPGLQLITYLHFHLTGR
jgi:diadenosine tetraphosphate (Ap4A) HIT family hydrolase